MGTASGPGFALESPKTEAQLRSEISRTMEGEVLEVYFKDFRVYPEEPQDVVGDDDTPLVFKLRDTILTVKVKWMQVWQRSFETGHLDGNKFSWELRSSGPVDNESGHAIWVKSVSKLGSIRCAHVVYNHRTDRIQLLESVLLGDLVELGGSACEAGMIEGKAASGRVDAPASSGALKAV